MHVRQKFILFTLITFGLIAVMYFFWPPILWSLIIILPLVGLGTFDILQKRHAIRKNFPVIGNLRYLLESIRPEIMQYFVETDTDGKPFDRIQRTMVYERAKNVSDTAPFGTQMDVNAIGYEWMNHSIYAKDYNDLNFDPRVLIGGKDCKQPYSASLLNISAMSYGSLSMNAVQAMNKGAKKGNFAQNTGEGGLSDHHLKFGGDVIWQIGTGYFGCRTSDGQFSPERFQEKALKENVKMIEIKLSQGAKPGHGGILPAIKNTEEIAAIRHIEPYTTVFSPPRHKAFNDAEGLMKFIKELRTLSNGKPIGFKLCVGSKEEFLDICIEMIKTGISPDFITVDGGEGGTGAAPVEFSNSIGAPLVNGLTFVHNALVSYDLKKDIKIICSGKIVSGFHIARSLALGADLCNSARAMMMAVGCIQALKCDTNKCPTGVATQDKQLMKGLDVGDKSDRVASFHKRTIKSFVEMLGAAGFSEPSELNRFHINKRVDLNQIVTLEDIYPYSKVGTLRDKSELIYQQT